MTTERIDVPTKGRKRASNVGMTSLPHRTPPVIESAGGDAAVRAGLPRRFPSVRSLADPLSQISAR